MNEQGEKAQEEAWAMVALLVGSGILGIVVGFLLDRFLGTQPWLMVTGAIVGFSLGMFLMLRSALGFARRSQRRR